MSRGRIMAYLVEMDLLGPADQEVTLYFSDIPVRPFPSTDPDRPNQRYDNRLLEAPSMSLDIFADASRLAGNLGVGRLTLSNADGALNQYRGWAFRTVHVWWGEPAQRSFAAFRPFLAGRAETPTWAISANQPSRLVVPVYDARLDLERDIQETTFAGTNVGPDGYEGGPDDLRNRVKPLALGDLVTANIPLVWVNGPAQVGQVHDGEIEELSGLYDRGADANLIEDGDESGVDFDNAEPDAGHLVTDLGRGLVRVNQDFGGDVTVGVKGAVDLVPAAGYLDTVPPQIRALILLRNPEASIGASFTALTATETAKAGLYIPDRMAVRQAVQLFAAGLPGWVLPDPLGTWQIGKLRLPSGTADRIIRPVDVISITPGDRQVSIPCWKVTVRGERYYRTHTRQSLAESLWDTEDEARLREEWREALAEDTALRDRWWPNVREVVVDTALRDPADMQLVADLLFDVMSVRPDETPWEEYLVTLEMDEEWLDLVANPGLGKAQVQLIYPPDGIDRLMIVMGAAPGRPAGHQITLRVWG